MTLAEDGVFMSSMAVLLVSAYKFTVKYCYNSKCEDFSCLWGILRIRRNIQAEVDLDSRQQRLEGGGDGDGDEEEEPGGLGASGDIGRGSAEHANFQFQLNGPAERYMAEDDDDIV
jgi:hypothetical protein